MSWSFLALSLWSFISVPPPPQPPRASLPCPQESSVPEAPLLIPFAHGKHLKDSNPIFTPFIFLMPITFYYIYLKHRAGEGSQCLLSSNFLPHQLLTEAVSRFLRELLLKWLGATWRHSPACRHLSLLPVELISGIG